MRAWPRKTANTAAEPFRSAKSQASARSSEEKPASSGVAYWRQSEPVPGTDRKSAKSEWQAFIREQT